MLIKTVASTVARVNLVRLPIDWLAFAQDDSAFIFTTFTEVSHMMRPVFLVSPVAKIDRFPFRLSQLGGPDNDRRACVVRVAEGHRRSSPNVHISLETFRALERIRAHLGNM